MSRERAGRARALAALLLLAPVPSLGVLAAMELWPGTSLGRAAYLVCKAWIVLFPALWYLLVERGRLRLSAPRVGHVVVGAAVGLVMAAMMVAVFWALLASRIQVEPIRAAARQMGLDTPAAFATAAAGWILVNSLIEEYVYRWFILRQCESLLPGWAAVLASALIFTAHHVVALAGYLPPMLTSLGAMAVFAAGVAWGWLWVVYRSIWPPWVSHVVADAAVFLIGWKLLF